MTKKKYHPLFDDLDDFTVWKKEWVGMPEYGCKKLKVYQSITMHFDTKEDRDAFAELIGQNITNKTKYLYYPKKDKSKVKHLAWVDEKKKSKIKRRKNGS